MYMFILLLGLFKIQMNYDNHLERVAWSCLQLNLSTTAAFKTEESGHCKEETDNTVSGSSTAYMKTDKCLKELCSEIQPN